MVNALVQLSVQQPTALKVIGPIAIVLGLITLVGAIIDPARYVSRWYEANEDSRLGWWAISRSPESFRFWIGFSGLFAIGIGVAMVVIVF